MPRDILTDTAAPSGEAPVATSTATPARPAVVDNPAAQARDALAQAFPAWDLLPAMPFVRRSKAKHPGA
jgi:hypothetical protein